MEYAAPAVPNEIRMVAEAMGLSLTGRETAEELGALCANAVWDLMRKLELPSLKAKGFTREQCLKAAEEGYSSHLSTFCPVPVTREAAEKMAARMYDAYQ